jgi:protease I
MTRLDGKQALFVVYNRFSETEYKTPRAILEGLGVVVVVASSSLDAMLGHRGNELRPDLLLGDVHAYDYDAIVFVGGDGYDVNDPEAQRLAQEAVAADKVVAAICKAPVTLALAGVVEGKRVTASGGGALENAGAIFTGAPIERDGLIITAAGPLSTRLFGEAIAVALAE